MPPNGWFSNGRHIGVDNYASAVSGTMCCVSGTIGSGGGIGSTDVDEALDANDRLGVSGTAFSNGSTVSTEAADEAAVEAAANVVAGMI